MPVENWLVGWFFCKLLELGGKSGRRCVGDGMENPEAWGWWWEGLIG